MPVIWTPPKKKKKKSATATADTRVGDSGTVFSTVGDNLAEKPRHSENDAPTITRHLCFSATASNFHYTVNCLHRPHNKSKANTTGDRKQCVKFLQKLSLFFTTYVFRNQVFFLCAKYAWPWLSPSARPRKTLKHKCFSSDSQSHWFSPFWFQLQPHNNYQCFFSKIRERLDWLERHLLN